MIILKDAEECIYGLVIYLEGLNRTTNKLIALSWPRFQPCNSQ